MPARIMRIPNRFSLRWFAPALAALVLVLPLSASADHRDDGLQFVLGAAVGYALHDAHHRHRHAYHYARIKHRQAYRRYRHGRHAYADRGHRHDHYCRDFSHRYYDRHRY